MLQNFKNLRIANGNPTHPENTCIEVYLNEHGDDSPIFLTHCHQHPFFAECNELYFFTTQIRGNILGLLKCKDLQFVSAPGNHSNFSKALKIVEKYMESRDILACQEELIEAGLKDYAKL